MEHGTPRLRSAFPQTPRRGDGDRNPQQRANPFRTSAPSSQQKPLPQIATLKSSPAPPAEPLIPETIIDAPSQRLYAVAFWIALWGWRLFDFSNLVDAEEQSLWLFMKWVAIDGVFLFGLPGLRIPWLEWSSATMTLIFLAHAVADGMLMFRIPIPIMAGLAVLWRGVWGAYETAINEHGVNPDTVLFNDSLILGRQIIHILPEGSAILNPERHAFCIDGQAKNEVRLPIMINATEPIGIDIMHVDLDTQANSTIRISKSQIKAMHKEASRLITYSDNPNEPKTLYFTVKKPGLYALAKVVDASNLEVSRKKLAHTVVVPCPRAEFLPAQADRCRGELSNIELEAVGTPPMKIKYRKVVNKTPQTSTFENIQPEDLVSPLLKQNIDALVVPNKVDTSWAKSHTMRVPLSEGLVTSGTWVYAIDEVVDGFGNRVQYSANSHKPEDKKNAKTTHHLHQYIEVHERPVINLKGCTPQQPLKVPKGKPRALPVQYASTGRGAIPDTPYNIEYIFSPQADMSSTSGHGPAPQIRKETVKNAREVPYISEPGLYTLTGVSTDFCSGDVLEPASCLLENPPEPRLQISFDSIHDKCAGSSIGLRVDLDLVGTPPFEVEYTVSRKGQSHHETGRERINGLRGQIELTPSEAGSYEYRFTKISDDVYKRQELSGEHLTLRQDVKPSASARLVQQGKQITCIDHAATFEAQLTGEHPFKLDYELIHNGKRHKMSQENISSNFLQLETPILKEGGDYTMALVSITDKNGCTEFLKDEAKVTVRHQKPKVSFGQIEGRRTVDTLEGKQVALPLRLSGEGPWTVRYLDTQGHEQIIRPRGPNDRLDVDREGIYELISVHDNVCPGLVDTGAKDFQINWIPRPQYRISPSDIASQKGNVLVRAEVCEGDEDAVEVLFKGSPPYELTYVQTVKPDSGTVAPRTKDLRAAVNVASLRMETAVAGAYEYKFSKLKDGNYDHSSKHFTPLSITQKVNARPSAAFVTPGKTYSFCSVESDGEEVIPVSLHGVPPFELEVEIKHHGTTKPEMVHYTNIESKSHSIRIPHSRLHLGKSAVSLRRVSDARGCSRFLDNTTPRVQISVHDAPTIVSLEERTDYCVGDRLNFGLSGVAPFQVFYTFEGHARKASVSSGNTFKRLAEKPGTFQITGLQDSASSCKASTDITKRIHGMPSVRVSKGKDSYVDIHEGGQAELTFDFGGTPPFEFTYTRSSNTDKHGKKKGQVLDMRSEVSDEHSMRIWASEEGTYEVVSIKDAHCAYTKAGINVEQAKGAKKRLGYY
ncbi:Nucleoporin [Cercospora beticola]|uniref:Nucleoporin n=1 Tax=Cercospora beticola TaxID=122368 RepID=A0A2G5HXE0_CERBT|nr:Nucleoporin [Cercospora beticola]PIA97206.1 Nucleoporin [Cercospora beticola]WPA98354.1 hypothetical protein RHO25_002966 [Cercospora beticola]CAK1359594.1 unnamed protein product [Cercospora beticola]